MSERGFIAVDRDVFEHPVFAPEPFTEREAWLWMIAEAVFKPARVRAGRVYVDLQRGQLAYATRFLAAKWRWSEARVRRYLGRLKIDAMIDAQPMRDATLITICNYDKYQSARRADDPSSDAASDALATQRRTREQEDTSSSSLRSEEDYVVTREVDQKSAEKADAPATPMAVAQRHGFDLDAFMTFWQAYPHKVGKQDALKAFEAVAKSGAVTFDELMAGLTRYLSSKPVDRPWCNPATWLRQGRWEDEPDHLSPPAGRTSPHRRHRSPHDAFAEAVASDLAKQPGSRFYQPAYRYDSRGGDAVIAGMAMVAKRRLERWQPVDTNDPDEPLRDN